MGYRLLRRLDLGPRQASHDGQNPIIRKGRHAISVSERRCFFQAMPWGRPMSLKDPKLHAEERRKLEKALDPGWTNQDIVQAWFPGVHSDVGGSYRLSESDPAIKAFDWMLEEARAKEPPAERSTEHQDESAADLPDGLLIDPEKRASHQRPALNTRGHPPLESSATGAAHPPAQLSLRRVVAARSLPAQVLRLQGTDALAVRALAPQPRDTRTRAHASQPARIPQ